MTDLSVRTYAFAVIIVLALSLPNAFAQETHRVAPGGSVIVDIECKNEGTKPEWIHATVVQASGLGVVENKNIGRETEPGGYGRAQYIVKVPYGTPLGTYTVILGCIYFYEVQAQPFSTKVINVEVFKEKELTLIETIIETLQKEAGKFGIPGFPWESIVAGVIVGLGVLAIKRRHRRSNP